MGHIDLGVTGTIQMQVDGPLSMISVGTFQLERRLM